MFNATPDEQRTAVLELNRLAAEGRWKPLIGQRFPLVQLADAHALQEANTLQKQGSLLGKIVLTP